MNPLTLLLQVSRLWKNGKPGGKLPDRVAGHVACGCESLCKVGSIQAYALSPGGGGVPVCVVGAALTAIAITATKESALIACMLISLDGSRESYKASASAF